MAKVAQRVKDKIVGGDDLVEEEPSSSFSQRHGFEETGFNLIRLIKEHILFFEPMLLHVTHMYAELPPRGRVIRFFFWCLAFVAQIVDMLISLFFALMVFAIVTAIVAAIIHGIGIDTFIVNFIKQLQTL